MNEYIKNLRKFVGHECIFAPGVRAIVLNEAGEVLLQKRTDMGSWGLPAGGLELHESAMDALRREVEEETGLRVEIVKLLGVYSDPARDPRGHSVSAVYVAKPIGGELRANTDAAEVRVFPDVSKIELGFDYKFILSDAGLV